jgi:hypothetical protein
MTFSFETLRGLLDADLAAEIERIHESMRELDRDLVALKEERERRARERRQREQDAHDEDVIGFSDEEFDT